MKENEDDVNFGVISDSGLHERVQARPPVLALERFDVRSHNVFDGGLCCLLLVLDHAHAQAPLVAMEGGGSGAVDCPPNSPLDLSHYPVDMLRLSGFVLYHVKGDVERQRPLRVWHGEATRMVLDELQNRRGLLVGPMGYIPTASVLHCPSDRAVSDVVERSCRSKVDRQLSEEDLFDLVWVVVNAQVENGLGNR